MTGPLEYDFFVVSIRHMPIYCTKLELGRKLLICRALLFAREEKQCIWCAVEIEDLSSVTQAFEHQVLHSVNSSQLLFMHPLQNETKVTAGRMGAVCKAKPASLCWNRYGIYL